jgi:hypothetical protein
MAQDRYTHGARVRTRTPRSPSYDNRLGWVVGSNLGEIGLIFQPKAPTRNARAHAWFLPEELEPAPA